MDIYQFQIKYLADEDRILLSLSSQEKERVEALLTRRYVQGLWPLLIKVLGADPAMGNVVQEGKAEAMAFHHEKSMQSLDYTKEYEEDIKGYPLGETPLLLIEAQIRSVNDSMQLCLIPSSRQGLTIDASHPLLHCLYQHLPKLSRLAEWNLNLPGVQPATKPHKLN